MDPLNDFANRALPPGQVPIYDGRYVYNCDSFNPNFDISDEKSSSLYANPDLIDMMERQRNKAFIPNGEKIVLERANPFLLIPKYVQNAEAKAFRKIFDFKGTTVTLNPVRNHVNEVIQSVLLLPKPPNNFLLAIPLAVSQLWLDFVYLISKFYRQITLLQLSMSEVRYLIAMSYDPQVEWKKELETILHFESARGVTRIFKAVPTSFINWFTMLNNIHIAKQAELFTLIIAQKEAFDRKGIFTGLPSYDIKRVTKFLQGKSLQPKAVKSKTFKFSSKFEEDFARGLHLYGEPENFTGVPLHRTIDVQNDMSMEYKPGQRVQKGGVHWKQRRNLMSDVEFLTASLNVDERAVVCYFGASPFDYGTILTEMFSNVNFILCDQRDVWKTEVREESRKPNSRTSLKVGEYDDKMIAEVFDGIKALKNVKKVLFISDMTSTSADRNGYIENETIAHHDMQHQDKVLQKVAEKCEEAGLTLMASLKFRLPFIVELGGSDYDYNGGILKTTVWSRPKSTELRLWWKPEDGRRTYNKKRIEEIMMYHNVVLKEASFGQPSISGYCECHDCHVEIAILTEYVTKFKAKVGIPIPTLVNGHVMQFASPSVFGITLAGHADKDRLRAKGFSIDTTKFNPPKENVRSNVTFEFKAEFVKMIKSSPNFKNTSDEVLSDIATTTLLYNVFQSGDVSFEPNEDITLELSGIEMPASLITSLSALNAKFNTKLSSELFKVPTNGDVDLVAGLLKSDSKGFYNISTKSDKPVATVGFHKNIFKRFLYRNERKYDTPISTLKGERAVLARVYSILKRLGPFWHEHLAYSLDAFFESRPELPGYYNGGSILSAYQDSDGNYSTTFGAIMPDLEMKFTELKSLSFASDLIQDRIVTVFAPPVRAIWTLFLSKVEKLLVTYSEGDKAVIVIIPEKYVTQISEKLSSFESKEQGRPFVGKFWDNMKEKEVTPKNTHLIKVFKTFNSTFILK